ncbi:MAG TPA: anion permease [candidate division Zixibacteria bacterium]|nr:anion permease [candidate division Zixibacteria bacterium]
MEIPFAFLLLLVLALVFGFLDGFHNSANVVATVISSRAMRPRQSLTIAAIAEFAGPFLFGVAVAKTIGSDLVEPEAVTVPVVTAAIVAAIAWKIITWLPGLPSSSSHSLFGGLIGAVIVASGVAALKMSGLTKIVVALLLSPIVGFIGGYLVMIVTLRLTRSSSPSINTLFKRGQLFTSVGLALSHGSNNAQKVMGIIALGMVSTGLADSFVTPLWVIALAAGAMALGTLFGGQRIIRTLGGKFYKIRPVHGFASQATSATIVLGASLFGGPVSTTQVVSSSIVGVGSAERPSKVRWGVFKEIGLAWILTIPATALIAALLYFPINYLMELIG